MIVGIDLGTTNCAVGVWRAGRVELVPNSLGHTLTPSAVSLDEATGELLVGLAARERLATHPGLTASIFKRYMGSSRQTQLGPRTFLPEELSAILLRRLKADAEAYLGEPVTEAVITVPAYFNDKQRKATRRAGQLAGLKVERLLNEPTAAALAFGIHQLDNETRFLVFDLGGGTFDVSILEIFEGVVEVRSSTGDNRLGGEDFNELLVEYFTAGQPKEWRKDRFDEGLSRRLRAAAERARRALTEADSTQMSVTWRDQTHEILVTTEAFDELCAPLIARLREPVLRSLRDAGIPADGLKEIVLVGGATRMPVVRRAVTRMFSRFPAHTVNPDEAVAMGAAIQAGLKARDVDLKEVVVTDVCPYTLGVETTERTPTGAMIPGMFAPIIERNTVIPASRVQHFSPLYHGQTVVEFKVFQGESRQVRDNVPLGSVQIDVPPDGPSLQIEVRFTYDINGLLEVDVWVPKTGERRELVIADEDTRAAPDFETRRNALSLLKLHPREMDANKAALARAERCYEDFLGDKRQYVSQVTAVFEAVLDRQDPKDIEQGRRELLAALDSLEGETWL